MKGNLGIILLGFGAGVAAGAARDIAQYGLDGIGLVLIIGCSLLVYFGAKVVMNE